MLEDDADALPRDPVRGPPGDVDAVDRDPAGVQPLDPHDQLHHRRLARPVRPDQAEDLARTDREPDVLHRDQAAEPLGQALDLEYRRGVAACHCGLGRNAKPSTPSGKNKITQSVIAETTNVLS